MNTSGAFPTKQLWLLIMLALPIVSFAAQITGQVFIVTKGGTSIKLALARVYLLTAAEAEAMRQHGEIEAKSITAAMTEKREAVALERQRIEQMPAKAQKEYEASLDAAQAAYDRSGDHQEYHEAVRKITATKAGMESAKLDADILTRQLLIDQEQAVSQALESLTIGYTVPPRNTEPDALTDADGQFTVDVPRDADTVLILADRQQPAENFRWLLPIKIVSAKGVKFLFSNHNLFRTPAETP